MDELRVLEPGTEVTLLGGIKGVIIAVMIEGGGRVAYKVLWPNGTSLTEMWVDTFVLQEPHVNEIRIGFGKTAA